MANLASFINELATVTGVKAESLKAFVETNKTVEIPDEVVNGIKGGILTLEAAKNNSLLHDHFHAQALNGVDTDMERFMNELKLDDKTIAEIKAENKTAKRVRLLATKLQDLQAEKINASGGDKKVLQEKIDALSNQLAEAHSQAKKHADELQLKIAESERAYENKLRDYKETEHYSSYQYANDKVPMSVQAKFAKTLTDEKLKELGLKTVFDKETGAVQLRTTSDTIYYKDNKPVDFKTFTDGLLADNQLLKVTEKPKGDVKHNINLSSNGNGGQQRDVSKMEQFLKTSLEQVTAVH